jgi:hypothetical protein
VGERRGDLKAKGHLGNRVAFTKRRKRQV